MDFVLVSFTLSTNSAISNLIVKKYNFFTPEGMNKEAIIDFLAREDTKHRQAYNEKLAQQKMIQEKIDSFAPSFKNDLVVVNKKTGEVIAQFEDKPDILLIKDQLGNSIAVLRSQTEKQGFQQISVYTLETYLKKTYALDAKNDQNAKTEAINKLILNDYLGNGANSYTVMKQQVDDANANAKQEAKEYEKAKRVTGLLTLNDGSTAEGDFEIDFREVMPDGTEIPYRRSGILSLDGKTAIYFYKDDKGKDKIKIYKEKQMQSFKVVKEEEPDYDEYYCKIDYIHHPDQEKVVNDGLDVGALGKNLLFGRPKKKTSFAYRVADSEKATIYTSEGKLFIADKKKDGEITELNPNTFRAQLKEIAADCPSVAENADSCQYTRLSIYNFIEEYSGCN
jgi:hypothetical protein